MPSLPAVRCPFPQRREVVAAHAENRRFPSLQQNRHPLWGAVPAPSLPAVHCPFPQRREAVAARAENRKFPSLPGRPAHAVPAWNTPMRYRPPQEPGVPVVRRRPRSLPERKVPVIVERLLAVVEDLPVKWCLQPLPRPDRPVS